MQRVLLPGTQGIGLIIDGFFSQDPAFGYPKGAILTPPTLSGTIHVVFAFIAITSIALGFFVLARRFSKEPDWRGWTILSLICGILTMVRPCCFFYQATLLHHCGESSGRTSQPPDSV